MSDPNSILLLDRDLPVTRYVSRFWTVFGARVGITTPVERARSAARDARVVYFHPDPGYERLAAAMLDAAAFRSVADEKLALRYVDGESDELTTHFQAVVDSAALPAPALVEGLADRIAADIGLVEQSGQYQRMSAPGDGVHVVGSPSEVFLHRDATIFPGTILDVRDGPVVIDARASVGQFSYIAGPSYVGPDARVDNCRLIGPTAIGRHCRVGGEIEASILGDFSNKHHEGFLGHSVVGRWVNLGALVTTSDLKNNYGEVRLSVPAAFLSGAGAAMESVPLDSIKFGSVIGDCVKVAIGMRLNTGTVLDTGSNVFGGNPSKYVAPFSWGDPGARYRLDRFVADCGRIFARRGQTVSDAFRSMAAYLWNGSDSSAGRPR